jgi:hypothetical protein
MTPDADLGAADEPETFLDRTLRDAATERERHLTGAHLLTREDATPELNRMGFMRWYLHPDLEGPSTRSLYVHELEIPPESRTGQMRCQGGIIHFVLDGHGQTVIDGVAHSWQHEDVIALPIRERGITYQHVNTGRTAARLLVVWPNLDSALGPEGGVEMAVLEDSPDFRGT